MRVWKRDRPAQLVRHPSVRARSLRSLGGRRVVAVSISAFLPLRRRSPHTDMTSTGERNVQLRSNGHFRCERNINGKAFQQVFLATWIGVPGGELVRLGGRVE